MGEKINGVLMGTLYIIVFLAIALWLFAFQSNWEQTKKLNRYLDYKKKAKAVGVLPCTLHEFRSFSRKKERQEMEYLKQVSYRENEFLSEA